MSKSAYNYTLFLTIDMIPKSLNRKLRSHRFANHKENKTWDLLIEVNTQNKKPQKPLEKARVNLIRYSARTLDYDGLVGSMKPVVDALVSAGILKDDSWNVLGKWDVDQFFWPKKLGSKLEIFVEGSN